MTKYLVFFAASLALCTMSPASATSSKPSLTVGQCNAVYAALLGLDTYQRVVKEGDADKTITDHYRLGGPLRFTIAEALAKLKPVFDATEKARLGIIAEVGGGKIIQRGGADELKVSRMYEQVLEKPCDAELPRIQAKDLNVGDGPGQNPIPPATLQAILPIVNR